MKETFCGKIGRPSGLVYRKPGRKVRIGGAGAGHSRVGTILTNVYAGRSASRPTLVVVERRDGQVVTVPTERVKVIM